MREQEIRRQLLLAYDAASEMGATKSSKRWLGFHVERTVGASSRQGAQPPPLAREERGWASPVPGRLGSAGPPPEAGSAAWRASKGLLSALRASRTPGSGAGRSVGLRRRSPRAGRQQPSPRPAFPGDSQRPAAPEPAAGRPGHPGRRGETPVLTFGGAMRGRSATGKSPCPHPHLRPGEHALSPGAAAPSNPEPLLNRTPLLRGAGSSPRGRKRPAGRRDSDAPGHCLGPACDRQLTGRRRTEPFRGRRPLPGRGRHRCLRVKPEALPTPPLRAFPVCQTLQTTASVA